MRVYIFLSKNAMKVIELFIFLGVFYVFKSNCLNFNDTKLFVTNLVEHEKFPAILLAKICWTQREKIDFKMSFSYSTSFFERSDEISKLVGDDRNKIWFLIDAKCPKTLQFLGSVDDYYFGHPFRWIILNGNETEIASFSFLPGSNVILSSEIDEALLELYQSKFFV